VSSGKVYFVGAGPGHPGLITLRGVACLKRADAVLYDYLANRQIVCHARPEAELICLGRHRRHDIWSQQSINDEMVRRARQGQCVVRLKGGDPMIFGRAGEELRALSQAGIDFEIVPGVTAASAAGAFAGVTITDRRHASAVALITGQEQMGKPDSSLDYQSLAHFPGTLVIYMGVSTVNTWSKSLLDAGKPADTPVLVVRRCSWPDQSTLACTLGTVVEQLTPYHRIPPPVVVIVGAAARQETDYDWFSRLPLLGQRIVITRSRHQAAEMAERINELGADALLQPAITIDEPADWQAVDDAIDRLTEFDYLVFSSANGVHWFLRRVLSQGADMRRLGRTLLAVIGPGTAEALRCYSLRPDVQPDTYRAEALADALAADSRGKRFLLLRASRGREVLADRLSAAGGKVEQVVVYRSEDVTQLHEDVVERLQADEVDWITITSSAIARSVCRLFGDQLHGIRLASISPITSDTLRQCGFEPTVEARVYTIEGIITAIREAAE
jgi:uroporphyrinogen III methyltransferase/synthase